MITVAVCDDNIPVLEKLAAMLKELCGHYFSETEIKTYTGGTALLEAHEETPFDVLFLDIRMPEVDGFSVVFQDFQLLALPLGENVAGGKDYDAARVRDCLEKAGFGKRLQRMKDGLSTFLYRNMDQDGVEISGGEAQKIALARALYKDAPIVVLDEPTAALDPVSEHEVYSGFRNLVGGRTAIFISHRLSSCRFCDEILVFHQGHLVQRGSHEELVKEKDGLYASMWRAQAQYYELDAAVGFLRRLQLRRWEKHVP